MQYSQAMLKSKGVVLNSNAISTSSKPFPRLTFIGQFNQGAFSSPLLLGLALNVIPAGFGIEVVRDRKVMS